ncbi:Fc.00g107760.m01.CDS01 [Cosmosporella sp. VM-42]
MATALLLLQIRNGVPVSGDVLSVVVSLVSTTILSVFLAQRFLAIKTWRRLPFIVWIVFVIYIDSYCFIFTTALLQQSFGLNSSKGMCLGAILLCLICYVSTKLIYIFLVEKSYIIRGTRKRRLQSKLYIFNSFGMLGLYVVVAILNFIFRITKFENGQCVIGMKRVAMIPLISFDFIANVYLTILFLIPLKNLYSFKNMARSPANIHLRTVAFRTFIGATCTLISSIVNLILFSAIVIQWVTSKDNAGSDSSPFSSTNSAGNSRHIQGNSLTEWPRPTPNAVPPSSSAGTDAEIALVTRGRSLSDHSSVVPKIAPPEGVFVTTTIRRQINSCSKPSDGNLQDEGSSGYWCPPERVSHGFEEMSEMKTSRTRIYAGSQTDPEP